MQQNAVISSGAVLRWCGNGGAGRNNANSHGDALGDTLSPQQIVWVAYNFRLTGAVLQFFYGFVFSQ